MDFRPIFKKCFSVLLVVNLLTIQVLFAGQAEAVFWSARRQAAQKRPSVLADGKSLSAQFPALSSCLSPRSDSVTAAVPPDFLKRHKRLFAALSPAHGTLRKISLAKNPAAPVVIHIQDVHMNREAQKNIRDTVYALGQSGQVDFVALEGATQKIDLDPFWNYPNPKAVSVTANYLLKENKISGPIHAALSLGKTRVPFLGIDDPVHYKANVKAYQNAAPHQREARADVRAFQRDLAGKKQTAYSPALLALDKTVNDFRAEKISLGNYVETLAKITPPHVVAHSFLKAVRAERTLDIKKVEDDQAKLIEKLSRTFSANDMDRLLAQSVAYRAGQVRSGDFYSALENICRINGLRLADFPAMDAYVQYVTLTDGIDAEKLMIEIADLEQAAYDHLAVSPSERALVAKSRQGFLAEKLINCDLTRLEWEEYAVKREKLFNGELAGFESFYREADARDHSMADNLLKKLVPQEDGHPPIAVLVTGGYHAKGMADQLVRQGVTVISYVPKISKVETGQGTAYLSVFTQEKTPLEKLFVGERLFLSPVPDQGLAFEGTLLVPAVDVLDRGITSDAVKTFIRSRTGKDVDVAIHGLNQPEGKVRLSVEIDGQAYVVSVVTRDHQEVVSIQTARGSENIFLSFLRDFLSGLIPVEKEQPPNPTAAGVPGGIPDQATIDQNLVRIESELRAMGIDDGKVKKVIAKVREVLETGTGFIRPKDPVRLTVYGDPKTKKPLIGPLPTGMIVDDLVPVGDLDWAVVVYTDFWSSTSYVVPFTPDHRIALVQIAWGPYAGMWTFPSGGSMPGYTPEQTAVSEVHDELGLSKRRAIQVKKIGMVPIGSGENEGEGYQVANLFMCQLTEADVLELLNNKKVLEDQRALLGEEKFLEWLGSQTLDQEGTGEISGIRFLTQEEFIKSLTSDPHTFAPEFVFFQRCGFLGFNDRRQGETPNLMATGVPRGIPNQATIEKHLTRMRGELSVLGIEEARVDEILPNIRRALETGKGFVRENDPVRLVVYGDRETRKPLLGPLPEGMKVEDLVPVGDLDYVVAHNEGFWFGSVFVVVRAPDGKFVMLLRPWNPYANHWTFPSGGLMGGKTATLSALHEIQEELGLPLVDSGRLTHIGFRPIQGKSKNRASNLENIFSYQLSDAEFKCVRENRRAIRVRRKKLGDEEFLKELAEKSLSKEGSGEVMDMVFLSQRELFARLGSGTMPFVPEIAFFRDQGFLRGTHDDQESGLATAIRWLKEFEKVGAFFGGELRRAQWGKAYKDFAATIELSSAFTVMLVASGGTVVLSGAPLGWAVAPLLGAVFGEQFYKGHFLSPGESAAMTAVTVSVPKAFTMAVIYGFLIAVTPFLLGFGPAGMAFFHPALAESLWGSAAALHLFFDRKSGAREDGKADARDFMAQLSTVPRAVEFLTPITADRTNQMLNSGSFSPDLADKTLWRLQNDLDFRAGFLQQIRTSLQDKQLSPLQLSLLSALLASTGEPLGIIHFLGADPEGELERIEKYSSKSVRMMVVAPTQQSRSVWQRTESLKTLGVLVVRKNPGDRGWTEPLLADLELENEVAAWLRSVPSALMATVGNGVKIDPTEIDRLGPDSRLKPALSNAVRLLANTLDLFFRFLQAVRASA